MFGLAEIAGNRVPKHAIRVRISALPKVFLSGTILTTVSRPLNDGVFLYLDTILRNNWYRDWNCLILSQLDFVYATRAGLFLFCFFSITFFLFYFFFLLNQLPTFSQFFHYRVEIILKSKLKDLNYEACVECIHWMSRIWFNRRPWISNLKSARAISWPAVVLVSFNYLLDVHMCKRIVAKSAFVPISRAFRFDNVTVIFFFTAQRETKWERSVCVSFFIFSFYRGNEK